MKLNVVVKTLLSCSVSYYFIYRLKLHFSLNLSFSNKNTLFLLLNFVLFLTIIIHNFCSTYATNDDRLNEELIPYRSDDIIAQGEGPSNCSMTSELIEEKYIVLVEKFAKEEDVGAKEEETILDTVLSKEADTEWRHDLIRKPVQRLELLVVEDLAPKVKEIVCIDEKLDKLDSDAVNRKYEEFIHIQRRKWRLDAVKPQLKLVKI